VAMLNILFGWKFLFKFKVLHRMLLCMIIKIKIVRRTNICVTVKIQILTFGNYVFISRESPQPILKKQNENIF